MLVKKIITCPKLKLEFSDACSGMNAILRLDLLVLQWPNCITLCVRECIGKNSSPTSARDKTKIKYISGGQPSVNDF